MVTIFSFPITSFENIESPKQSFSIRFFKRFRENRKQKRTKEKQDTDILRRCKVDWQKNSTFLFLSLCNSYARKCSFLYVFRTGVTPITITTGLIGTAFLSAVGMQETMNETT